MKRVFAVEEFCIGCRLCEIHCTVAHSKTKDIIKAFKDEYPKAESKIIFEADGKTSFAVQCRHCPDAPCVEACMTQAMYRDNETGTVLHDKDRCVGCWMCVMTCPYGAIKRDLSTQKIASKCDACYEVGGEPVCVMHCPNEALIVKDDDKGDVPNE